MHIITNVHHFSDVAGVLLSECNSSNLILTTLNKTQALGDLAALSDSANHKTREAETEKASLRAELARARIECEQLRGKVGEFEDEIYHYKLQV